MFLKKYLILIIIFSFAFSTKDKTLEMIDGDHYLVEPDDARSKVADLIAAWLKDHGAE